MLLAQLLCVGIGLYMHDRLLRPTDPAGSPANSGAMLSKSTLPALAVAFLWTNALLTLSTYLVSRRTDDALEREQARSANERLRQTQALVRTRDAVIFALAKLAGFRDHETGGHLERISDYATLLAAALRHQPGYRQQVTPAFVRLIGLCSVLHDIGKVGIEDSVLRKPGPLSDVERRCMQRHTVLAGRCLTEIAQRLGNSSFLHMAADIALCHHERWDGQGYPHGLKGTAIPLAARIVSIVDTYDALSMPRVYEAPIAHAECVAVIRAEAGKQFDPELVEVWLTLEAKFRAIADQHIKALAPNALDSPASATPAAESLGATLEAEAEETESEISPPAGGSPVPGPVTVEGRPWKCDR